MFHSGRRAVLLLALVSSLAAFTFPTTGNVWAAATIYVPDDYATIQAAVDAAGAGDTIIVRDSTYTENVVIGTPCTIQSENGALSTIVVAADSDLNAIEVHANGVVVRGFSVYGATGGNRAGIYLDGDSSGCTIQDNRCGWDSSHYNAHGIHVRSSNDNTVSGNICSYNLLNGIFMMSSTGNTVDSNTLDDNGRYGLSVNSSSGNIFSSNTSWHNGLSGIDVEGGTSSSDNDFSLNSCCHNVSHGIYLESIGNTYSMNLCTDNVHGIHLQSSSDNNGFTSNILNDNDYGIHFDDSAGNVLHLNRFNRSAEAHVYVDSVSLNTWSSEEQLSYVFDGTSYTGFMGNYYDDYVGADDDGNGIGDTAYAIGGDGNEDSFPIVLLVSPDRGPVTGSTLVNITCNSRMPLGDGSDISGVLLKGAVSEITGQSATQVAVKAGPAAAGTGDVSITSVTYGTTTKNDGFTYVDIGELDHFEFGEVSSPQFVGVEFFVTITANDSNGYTIPTYADTASLSVTSGAISPTTTGTFSNGTWTGEVTIDSPQTGISITASDGAIAGSSNEFDTVSGCFIATAAYGSALDSRVDTLRTFRDKYLLVNAPGRAFVKFYYRVSPDIAAYINGHPRTAILVRGLLWPLVLAAAVVVHFAWLVWAIPAALIGGVVASRNTRH